MKRILVSAGDPSGDLILAGVIRNIRELNPTETYEFVGLCGPASEKEGARSLASAKDVAVVGISEVLRNLKKIFGVLDILKKELAQCDSVLCVDFPDFNLKLSELARKQKVPVDFIIAPQVWAWRSGRLPKMKRLLRKIYPVLPFEEELLKDAGIDARFLGHPIRDLLPPKSRRTAREELNIQSAERLFCLMPGSRHSEILRHLPLFIEAWQRFEKMELAARTKTHDRVVVPIAPGWTQEGLMELLNPDYRALLQNWLDEKKWVFVTDSRKALMAADFGWIVSGTATLEAALYQVPHILVYRLSWSSAFLIRFLSHYFTDRDASAGLPNILLGKSVIPELLQEHVDAKRLAIESFELLHDPIRMAEIERSLRFLPKKLGDAGAIRRIAQDLSASWK